MKLISLNAWGGKLHDKLIPWVRDKSQSVDVFCFQEVYGSKEKQGFHGGSKVDLLQDLELVLTDFETFMAPKCVGYTYDGFIGGEQIGCDVLFGNVIFVRKHLQPQNHEQIFEYIDHPNHDWKQVNPPKAHAVRVKIDGRYFQVINFHGMWKHQTHKRDIPERLAMSKEFARWASEMVEPKIVCGDFNLLPSTESLKILKEGYRDLIAESGVTSTRSSHYSKSIGFADYILTSPEIIVKDFKVLPDEVSDHLPLFLDFR